jgi:hypothetical protein
MSTRGAKIFIGIVVGFAILFLGSGLLVAGTIAATSLVTVSVHDKSEGTHVYLPVPAAALYLGMDLLPLVMDDSDLIEMRRDMGDWGPFVAATMRGLADCPDGVLVDIRDGEETVSIVKEGESFRIRVRNPNESVDISVPARMLSKVARLVA